MEIQIDEVKMLDLNGNERIKYEAFLVERVWFIFFHLKSETPIHRDRTGGFYTGSIAQMLSAEQFDTLEEAQQVSGEFLLYLQRKENKEKYGVKRRTVSKF